MDFWCHASALFALSWARGVQLDAINSECSWRTAAAAVRTAGSAQRFHRAHRETPWRAASALASAFSLEWCSYTACSSRLNESRCHSLPTLIPPLALALTLIASSFGLGLTQAASSASDGALNSAICYAQLCTTQSRSRQLKLDGPIGRKLWT